MYVMPTVSPHGADVNSLDIEITTADHSRLAGRSFRLLCPTDTTPRVF
jgi:hypothetical protein